MENVSKINAKLAELKNNTGHDWLHISGFSAITGFDFGQNGQSPNFNPGFGYPVKVFVDKVTGEVKLFSAGLFKD